MTMPAKPIIEPIDRSNSPPIIRSATAAARMPSSAETCRTLMMPRGAEQAGVAGDDGEDEDDEDGAGQRAELGPAQELGEARGRPQPVVYGDRHASRSRWPGRAHAPCRSHGGELAPSEPR